MQVATDLLLDLKTVIGCDHRVGTESHVARLEKAFGPIFASMLKDTRGRLDAACVCYQLHRLFIQRHGW